MVQLDILNNILLVTNQLKSNLTLMETHSLNQNQEITNLKSEIVNLKSRIIKLETNFRILA